MSKADRRLTPLLLASILGNCRNVSERRDWLDRYCDENAELAQISFSVALNLMEQGISERL
jgi:hypothetical protein